MELYSAKVLLGGSRDNEARVTDVTAAEILVLKHIHGQDSVSQIVPIGAVQRTQLQERQRLLGVEGETPPLYKHTAVRAVFASDMTPLPESLPVDMIDAILAAALAAKASEAEKPVDEMTQEEQEAELAQIGRKKAMLENLSKARAKRAENAAQAAGVMA